LLLTRFVPPELQNVVSCRVRAEKDSEMPWDVFISHATEDKGDVARPLAELLRNAGLTVWLDENELQVGDSLRSKIDEGLSHSRFGIVIVSPAFFSKQWPQHELNGLLARESVGTKILLPVWYNVDHAFVEHYSPILADRVAANANRGLDAVADEVLKIVAQHPLQQHTSPDFTLRRPDRTIGRGKRYFFVAGIVLAGVLACAYFWQEVSIRKSAALERERLGYTMRLFNRFRILLERQSRPPTKPVPHRLCHHWKSFHRKCASAMRRHTIGWDFTIGRFRITTELFDCSPKRLP
jgi:hypothetical protein